MHLPHDNITQYIHIVHWNPMIYLHMCIFCFCIFLYLHMCIRIFLYFFYICTCAYVCTPSQEFSPLHSLPDPPPLSQGENHVPSFLNTLGHSKALQSARWAFFGGSHKKSPNATRLRSEGKYSPSDRSKLFIIEQIHPSHSFLNKYLACGLNNMTASCLGRVSLRVCVGRRPSRYLWFRQCAPFDKGANEKKK